MRKRVAKFYNDTYAVFLWVNHMDDKTLCFDTFKAKNIGNRWKSFGARPKFPYTPEGYAEALKLYEQYCKEMSDWIDQQIAEGEL